MKECSDWCSKIESNEKKLKNLILTNTESHDFNIHNLVTETSLDKHVPLIDESRVRAKPISPFVKRATTPSETKK